jgi:hypothetical protein
MSTRMMQDPVSKLILPAKFIDERTSLSRALNELVEKTVSSVKYDSNYFLTIHAMFDKGDPTIFKISEPKLTKEIPSFHSNTMVWWVCPKRGIKELLWMVTPKKKGEKLKVEFNKDGVAYLQAKGAMPS